MVLLRLGLVTYDFVTYGVDFLLIMTLNTQTITTDCYSHCVVIKYEFNLGNNSIEWTYYLRKDNKLSTCLFICA